MSVLVLMPTYNGERYLAAQIDSILAQEGVKVSLLFSDDGSTDGTLSLLEGFDILPFERRLGPSQNVSRLLEHTAPYVALADQDDVWERDKLVLSLQKMGELEALYGRETPLLVHTDLKVVDKELRESAPSFFSYNKFHGGGLNQLLMQNTVTGCTLLMNEALASLATPIPPEAIMHDWWIALVASAFGKIGVINRPLVHYRQHGSNAIGATTYFDLAKIGRFRKMRDRKFLQAAVFLNRYRERMTLEQVEMFEAFCNLRHQSYFATRATLLKYGFYGDGFFRRVFTLIFG